MMSDDELLRYSRHILLNGIDVEGQELLCQSRVLIIGLGGLGSPVALYLAASGVGHLTLADFDVVDASNLQRQIAHTESHIGVNKAQSAKQAVQLLNSRTSVACVEEKITDERWQNIVKEHDVVVDCTDNFSTRFAINQACYHAGTPLVSGAAIRFEGQLSVFDFRNSMSPCYQCLYSDQADSHLSCAESGVLSPLVGIIGSMQALETIKLITLAGQSVVGRLIVFDAKTHQWQQLHLSKDPSCPVCAIPTTS